MNETMKSYAAVFKNRNTGELGAHIVHGTCEAQARYVAEGWYSAPDYKVLAVVEITEEKG